MATSRASHNRSVHDPSIHGETDAFRKAGRQRRYADTIMGRRSLPCWYCSGLVRQLGSHHCRESVNFQGGIDWLREAGFSVIDLKSQSCIKMLATFISKFPHLWNEVIGVE